MHITPDISLYSVPVWGQHELQLKALSTSTHPFFQSPWLLTPSCRLHWFSFTGIKTLAWVLLTAQVFTANKNFRLQKQKKCWNCREIHPTEGASPWCLNCGLGEGVKESMTRVGLTRLFNLLFPTLLSFHEQKRLREKQMHHYPLPCGGKTCWDCSERFGLFSYLKWSGPSSQTAGGKVQLNARKKRDWSNQCFLDKVGGKTCEECSISISYC